MVCHLGKKTRLHQSTLNVMKLKKEEEHLSLLVLTTKAKYEADLAREFPPIHQECMGI